MAEAPPARASRRPRQARRHTGPAAPRAWRDAAVTLRAPKPEPRRQGRAFRTNQRLGLADIRRQA
jgi:hypothetical protein